MSSVYKGSGKPQGEEYHPLSVVSGTCAGPIAHKRINPDLCVVRLIVEAINEYDANSSASQEFPDYDDYDVEEEEEEVKHIAKTEERRRRRSRVLAPDTTRLKEKN